MNNLLNETSILLIQLQDKGSRFVVVDMEIDQNKAQEQINRSSFKTLVHDASSNHINIVSNLGSEKVN